MLGFPVIPLHATEEAVAAFPVYRDLFKIAPPIFIASPTYKQLAYSELDFGLSFQLIKSETLVSKVEILLLKVNSSLSILELKLESAVVRFAKIEFSTL